MPPFCFVFFFLLPLRSQPILIPIVLTAFLTALSHADETPSSALARPSAAIEDNNLSVVRSSEQIRALVIQPDGNIVTAGASNAAITNGFALARYKPDGSPDAGFGQGGKVTTRLDNEDIEVTALALQGDGKLLITGQTSPTANHPTNIILTRYNSNGRVDAGFGANGTVRTVLPSNTFSTVSKSVMQADGKLLVAAHSLSPEGDLWLVRYEPDGKLDAGFGIKGFVKSSPGFSLAKVTLTLQPDGKILVGGTEIRVTGAIGLVVPPRAADFCPGPSGLRVFLARYNTDGSIDRSFGDNGAYTFVLADLRTLTHLAFQPDGKIVLSGDVHCRPALTRYHTDGSVDTTFGVNGIVQTEKRFAGSPLFTLQPDGKILSVLYAYEDLLLTRHHANGVLDASFGVSGAVTLSLRDATALAIQPNGDILAAGYMSQDIESDFAIARYHADGSVDTDFGSKGLATTNFALFPHADHCETTIPPFSSFPRDYRGDGPRVRRDEASTLLLQPDGKILVAGTAGYALTVLRYTANGDLDRGFGVDGVFTTRLSSHPKYADLAFALALQPDGKILVIGMTHNEMKGRPFLVRLTADGRLDASFGTEGKIIPSVGSVGSALAVLSDGKILAVVGPNEGWPKNWFLLRFLPDGNLDWAFGVGGIVTVNFENLNATLAQPNGGLLLIGARMIKQTKSRIATDFILERYSPTGSVDKNLGVQGKVALDTWNEKVYPSTFALQPDGKIVGGGLVPYSSNQDLNEEFLLVRYNSDGSRDPTFGEDGKVIALRRSLTDLQQDGVGLPLSRYFCSGLCHVTIQDNSNILAVGRVGKNSTVFRYLPDGSIDTSFGNAGKVTLAIGAQSTLANAFTVQQDGKLILAGLCANARHTNIFLARYNPDGSIDPTFSADGQVTIRIGVAVPPLP